MFQLRNKKITVLLHTLYTIGMNKGIDQCSLVIAIAIHFSAYSKVFVAKWSGIILEKF